MARDIRSEIGLTERQRAAVGRYRRLLEEGDSEALRRALRDRRFDGGVQRAIRENKPLSADKIERMVQRYRERYLKYRAETIARTEGIRAVQAGQQLLWEQAVAEGKIEADQLLRSWFYTADSKVRDWHRTIPRLNPNGVGLNESFRSEEGLIRYPGDPNASAANTINCRCAVIVRPIPAG